MKKHLSYVRKYVYMSICVMVIGTIELLFLREKLSLMLFTQWHELGRPPSEPEYVVEYGYVKCKDGNIYEHYSLIDPRAGWQDEWLAVNKVDEYYSYDEDISTCSVPDIVNVKSLVIRCRKLENYSKTYAMAIGKDGRIFDYINSSTEEIVSFAKLFSIILLVNVNFGLLIIIMGYIVERTMEGKKNKRSIWKKIPY
jgi:hypothetical protein